MKKSEIKLENFNFFGGKHCQTTAIKSILDYKGLSLSEEMLFGLGGGIGFIYFYNKNMTAPFIGGRNGKPEDFILNICDKLNITSYLKSSSSIEKTYNKVKNILQSGNPVYTFVDMAYLDYLALPDDAHFGGHTIAVYGIDEEKDIVYIADRSNKSLTTNIDAFKKALSSKSQPFPAKNKVLEAEYPNSLPDLSDAIEKSLLETCETMLNPPIKNFGLAGMLKWAKLSKEWDKYFSGHALFTCLFNVFVFLETGGTGGQAFRPMYSEFLKEATEITGEEQLSEVAKLYSKTADAWKNIAHKSLPDKYVPLKRIRELMYETNKLFEEYPDNFFKRKKELDQTLEENTAKSIEIISNSKAIKEILHNLSETILECHSKEKEAVETLAGIIRYKK